MAAKGVPAGASLKAVHWAMVTGTIPVKQQVAEYVKQFANVEHKEPEKDYPTYAGFIVKHRK